MILICWKRSQNFVLAERPKMKIVVLDGHCLNPGDLDWKGLEKFGSLEVHPRTSPDELLNRAKDADVLVTNKCILTNDYRHLQFILVLPPVPNSHASVINQVDCLA